MLVIKIDSGDTSETNEGKNVQLLTQDILYLELCEIFYTECVRYFPDRLYDLLNDINLFTGLSSEKIKGSLSTLNVFGKDEYFINQLKTLKQWNKKKLTMKSNKQEIVKIFDDFAKNQRISQLIFSFFCLYWDCFHSPVNEIYSIEPSRVLELSKRQNRTSEKYNNDEFFKNLELIYKNNERKYSPFFFSVNNVSRKNAYYNSLLSHGMCALRKLIYRDYKYPFDFERTFFSLSWTIKNTVSLDAHHEFENTIFSNIRPVKSDSESIVDLNNCNEINFSIILESEYLIAVFICDFIQNIIDESEFSTMFSSENFSKNEQLALKEIYEKIESIDELEPFKSEISGSLTHYLNIFKKDVHLVFAFQEESLNSVVSVFTKQRIRDKVFGNQKIYKILFDLYKKYLKRSAENSKKIKCVKSIDYMDKE
ncbi:hypothetical protein CWI39_0116p0030 [Hamiltosporidium magnivora]|uniref:Uncharacterized protein n=1 Tax=Hamiltosporidium magnivora TaxID=148818 RepID=A0A4Q9LL25_9MICR|nr:hypothetical protein CWI39_0116p0030 [Hamiltosporidium magnivora]